MVNINAILAALFCATAPVASLPENSSQIETVQSSFQLGKETISQARKSYEKGKYNEFLKEMDASYAEADLRGLEQMRNKQVPLEFQEASQEQFLVLQKQKNEDLLSAISDKDDSLFAKKVRSTASTLTPEQEKALSKLNSFIAMAPNSGANADENKLIEIDLEYEYKLLHAELPNQEISSQERTSQQIALRMEKMDKMVKASKSFQDTDLKKAVGIASDTLDARLARNLDSSDLNSFVKGKSTPANATEESITAILSSYQGKFSDLMKQIDQANR